jgi:Holliday junction resolvase-like predicted endonuclease
MNQPARAPRRTRRRRQGDRAEDLAVRYFLSLGWLVLARNVTLGHDELDVVAVDPGPPPALVFAEVRSNVTGRYGEPEESVVGGKLRRTYRAAWGLLRVGALPHGRPIPRLPWRVDVLIVEQRPYLARDIGGPILRHLRAVAPE